LEFLSSLSREAPAADRKDRLLLIIGAAVAIAIGVGMMKWTFAGAVLVSVVIGVGATARGVGLITTGISERSHQPNSGF